MNAPTAAEEAVSRFSHLAEQAYREHTTGSPPWLTRRRSSALAEFARHGFPTRKQEAWRYTSLDKLLAKPLTIAGESGFDQPDRPGETPRLVQQPAARLVICDGRYLKSSSWIGELPEGVRLAGLRDMLAADTGGLEGKLGSVLRQDNGAFEYLNTAFIDDGLYIEVAPGVNVEGAIEIIYTSRSRDTECLLPIRSLVIMHEKAEATIIEHFGSASSSQDFTTNVMELVLAEDSRLAHYRLQNEAAETFHKSTLALRQGAASTYRGIAVSLGARWSRCDYRVEFAGESATCDLKGLYVTGEGQLDDFHVDIDHRVPACKSEEHFKGILLGASRAVFDGRVKVAVDAQKTAAHLKNDNLLLSRNAEIDTKPLLEIFADDVQCSHGTTVGQIEDAQLYYLRTRGIDEQRARRMLCSGFAREVLLECSNPEFVQFAAAAIEERL